MVAVTIAVAVNSDDRREVLGMTIGASEADFLGRLSAPAEAPRPSRVKLVISDANKGTKAAVARGFRAPLRARRQWSALGARQASQRCHTAEPGMVDPKVIMITDDDPVLDQGFTQALRAALHRAHSIVTPYAKRSTCCTEHYEPWPG